MLIEGRTEGDTIQAPMELALPQFGGLGNRSVPVHKPWTVSTDSPASPDPACTTDLARSPSPCLNLDTLSLDDAEESVIPRDISVTVHCGSEEGHTPVSSDQVLSDVDLPAVSDSRDRRQVLQTQELSPVDWFVRRRCLWDARRMAQMGSSSTPLVFRIRPRQSGCGPTSRDFQSVAGPSSVVGPVVMQGVRQVETVHLSSPTMLGKSSPGSPQTIAFEDRGDSLVPLSPNCVQAGRSQEMPADGSLRTHQDL